MLDEKEDVIDSNRPFIFDEVHLLLSTCKDIQTKETILRLMPLIKRAFADIFFINSNYTFEELIFKIKNFDKECEKIFKRIEDLDTKKEDFILQSKKNKKNKKDKTFFSQLKKIDKEVELENNRYNSYRAASKILEDVRIKDKIINFCNYLSILVFSSQKISKDELKKIIFDFLWIVNRMERCRTNKQNRGVFEKIISKVSKKESPGEGGNGTQTEGIHQLIIKANISLQNNDFFTAENLYRKILSIYDRSPGNLRKSIYDIIFTLWFRLYFYPHF